MDPIIKKQWIEALRSGEYKQTTGQLCKQEVDGQRFCCLGVLTDLYLKERYSPEARYSYWEMNGGLPALPTYVIEWARTPSCDPEIFYKDELGYTLSGLNDDGMSFEGIAKVIESQEEEVL